MPLLHTLQIRTDDLATSRVREEIPSPSLSQRLKHLCALPPRCVRGVLAIGISLLLFDPCQLAFAQAIHAGTMHTTMLPSTQPEASGPACASYIHLHVGTGDQRPAPPPRLFLLPQPPLAERFRM